MSIQVERWSEPTSPAPQELKTGRSRFSPANTLHSAFVPGDQPVIYLIGAKY